MMPKRKVVKKKSAGKKAVEKKEVKRPRGYSQYSETKIREALFAAACNQKADGSLGYTTAAEQTGINKQRIFAWAQKHTDILEEIKPEVEAFRAKRDGVFKENLFEVMMLGINFSIKALERCFDKKGELILEKKFNKDGKVIGVNTVESLRDVVGMVHMYTEKKQLLEGKPTSNLGGEMNLVFTYGMANMSDNKPIPNNRIKGNQN